MKARITCGPDSAHLALDIASMDDAALAIDAVKATARLVWPAIVFSDEPDWAEEEAPKKRKRRRTVPGPLKEGSFDARVLEATQRLRTTDRVAIADDLDALTGVTAMSLARLRKGGHIGAAE